MPAALPLIQVDTARSGSGSAQQYCTLRRSFYAETVAQAASETMVSIDRVMHQACARLKASGLRITRTRVAMLQVLASDRQPRSIESIYSVLPVECDLITLYRSLEAMEEVGIIRRTFGRYGLILYQFDHVPERFHVLSNAEPVSVLEAITPPPEMLLALQSVEDTLRARGYTSVTHTIQFYADRTPHSMPLTGGPGGEFINGL